MVHQHFMLVPIFTVTENVILGNEKTGNLNYLKIKIQKKVRAISEKYSLLVNPKKSLKGFQLAHSKELK